MTGLDSTRILIVENEGLVGCDMATSLKTFGYQVIGTCTNSEDALRLFDTRHPDLVLMDVHIDGSRDGIETARLMQQRGSVAIVYVTACADHDTVKRARKTRPYGYLLKPFSHDELRLTVEVAASRFLEETERRRREQNSLEAFNSLSDGVIATDLAGVITFINPAAAEATGWKLSAAVGKSLHEVFRIYQVSGEPAQVELPDPGEQPLDRIVWLTNSNGGRIPVQDRAGPLKDEKGALAGVVILFRPISTPARSQPLAAVPPTASAHPAQETLIDVVETISDPLIALDGRWSLIYANTSAQRLFEQKSEKLLGTHLWDLLPKATRDEHHEALAQALLHRESTTRELYFEEKQVWLELRSYPFAEGMLILLQDITSRREEAERRHRMDRLEALGLLARGFAHEFNNLLTVLLGNLALADSRLSPAIQLPELECAHQATVQAQGLVQQLLTFARGGAPVKRPTQMAELVEQFFLHHTRAPQVEYRYDAATDMPLVSVDPVQMRRLLGNLIRNAEQALPNGGLIQLRCFAAEPGELYPHEIVSDHPAAPAGIVIEVDDNGEGIAPHHLAHIFEPYFTTRKAANATGLGLTVCESIAKAHSGSLSVRSEPGNGTSVRFYLPVDADAEDVAPLGLSGTFESHPAGTTPRLLILEDDPLVLNLVVRSLGIQGYDITESIEGSETVRLYQEAMEQGRPYDLVILDLSIPKGMGGVRVMEELLAMDPDVSAIVSSGYSDDPVMARPATYGFAAVLPKPYEPTDMLRVVKSVLAARVRENE